MPESTLSFASAQDRVFFLDVLSWIGTVSKRAPSMDNRRNSENDTFRTNA